MLNRLESTQEQTVWWALWDKVCSPENLDAAILKVIVNKGSAGVDNQTTHQLAQDWDRNRNQLLGELRAGQYQPLPVKRVWIDKAGSKDKRPLGVPAVRDRAVQTALRAVMEPIFEKDFSDRSYGFRPGRGCLQALERVESLLRAGHTWIVDADIKAYFDSIPQDKLLEQIERRIADGTVLRLIRQYLEAGVMETMRDWKPTLQGTPQGSGISPLLANIYLNPLDHQMSRANKEMVRYADDFVICCRTEAEAQEALAMVAGFAGAAGLKLHPEKTRIVNAAEKGGFDFLGYHFERYREGGGLKWPRKKSLEKLRASIREKTRRGRPGAVSQIIAEINPTLRGWYGYFKYSIPTAMVRVDEWVRERIRHILRRRQKRQGMVKGRERTEYPIAWFAGQGLFSLKNAQAQWIQSQQGTH
jgi:RNA-directed DNA polymerase